jgi:hypothetical protein
MSTLKVTNIQNGSATNIAMVLDTAGTVQHYSTISVGNATPSSSGAGITFPATQSASSNANTLDDYEEGSFVPTLVGESSAGTTTYSNRSGYYTKIGNMVFLNVYINITAMTGTGNLIISSLPFASANVSEKFASGSIWTDGLNWGGGTMITPFVTTNSSTIRFYYSSDDGSTALQQCVNEAIQMNVTVAYYTAT